MTRSDAAITDKYGLNATITVHEMFGIEGQTTAKSFRELCEKLLVGLINQKLTR